MSCIAELSLQNFHFFNSFPGEVARDTPYVVNITIPVEGYEPIQFVLTKMCGECYYLNLKTVNLFLVLSLQ